MMPAKRPVNEIRYGFIKVLVWENETANGPRYNVTAARLYKDGDDWKETFSFGRDDLLLLAKALNHAHTWIYEQKDAPPRSDQV
jgi:hypothetical protein